jgi:dTMP kinase
MPGRLIVLEGLDGSGTTTQRSLLAKALEADGHAVIETWEPTDGPIGAIIRRFLRGELPLDAATVALLFAADRLDHVRQTIRPALDRGAVVVSDRYTLSSLAYQSVDLDPRWIAEINREALVPDLTIYLDVPPEVCYARITARGQASEHFERLDRLRATARSYRRAIDAARLAGQRVLVVDGPASQEAVLTSLCKAVQPMLG